MPSFSFMGFLQFSVQASRSRFKLFRSSRGTTWSMMHEACMKLEDHVDTLVIDHTGPSAHDIRLLGIAQLLNCSQ
jgi:hypothetical protein